jgi:hypothetical protein
VDEAKRTGHKWWTSLGQNAAKAVGQKWSQMGAEERRVFEQEAADAR